MFNFTKTNKSDSLNDKLQELENRFQEKMDEQTNAYKLHIQKLDEKFAGMEEKNKITYELMDKLYEYRFQEINNNTAKLSTQMSCKINHCISVYDNKLDNTFTTLQQGTQNITNQINILNNNQKEIFIEIQKLKNNAGNYFEEQIDTLTKQQEVTNEKLVALNKNITKLDNKIDIEDTKLYKKIDKLEEKLNEKIDGLEEKINDDIIELKIKIDKDEELWDILDNLKDNFEEKHSLTGELLLNVQNDIILINTHSKLGNKSQQNLNNELLEKIKIITNKVSDIENHLSDVFYNMIPCINEETQSIRGIISCLAKEMHQFEINQMSNPNIDTSIITDKLEICMNAIKKINVYEFPISTFNHGLLQHKHKEQNYYDSLNTNLGTSIIMLDDPHDFSYINQFYNLKVLVINNWALFNYGTFDTHAHMQEPSRGAKAAFFLTEMRDRYGEMNKKTLETFIIHTAYDFKTWATQGITTRKEPLMLEYLCMQFKNFPSLKIIKLYYLDLPENIEDILINNLKLMTHSIKELHIITNNNLKSSKLKNYCNNNNIMFVVPKFNDFIVKNPQSIPCFNMAFQWEVVQPLKQQLMMEDDSYMRRNKGYN
jgi:hypothetical protein